MREEDIKAGRWQRRDGLVVIVIGLARHTEGDYRLVVFHPEDKPTELQATPTSVWTEFNSNGTSLFRKLD